MLTQLLPPPNPATHTPPPLNPLQLPPWPVFSAGFALGDWVLSRLPTLVLPPNARVVGLSTAFIHSQALYCAAKLGLADALAAGPLAAGELARAKGVKEDHLRRVLRLLVAAGVFREPRPGEFRGVEAGRLGRGARGLHQRRRPECPRMGRGLTQHGMEERIAAAAIVATWHACLCRRVCQQPCLGHAAAGPSLLRP